MPIRRLRVQHFRNIHFADIELADRFNCFLGPNGAGKTTVLEAIYVLGRGRSFRASSLDTLVRHGANGLAVSVQVESRTGTDSMLLSKDQRKPLMLRINGQAVTRLSEAASRLPLQLLTPLVADLVLANPAERRQYLDWGLFHVEHRYHAIARDYSRALKQRNSWLRSTARIFEGSPDPWLSVLLDLSKQLDAYRSAYCDDLFPIVLDLIGVLEVGVDLGLAYFKGWREDTVGSLAETLRESAAGDVKSGLTRYGPHRADILVTAEGRPASQVLSRGQAKLAAIAMKVAQIQLLRQRTAKQSTVLFDELIAELDYQRAMRVLGLLAELGCQVIVSAVELPDVLKGSIGNYSRLFHVKQGAITALEE